MRLRALIVATVLGAVAGSAHAGDKIRFGTEGAYPPFNQIDTSGRPTGFDVDIANALCAELKAKCSIVTQDWDGIIPALNGRKFDALVASMSITAERQRAVDFTDPYYTNKLQFIAAKASNFSPTKLSGLVLGAQRATIAGTWLEEHVKDAEIKFYDTQDNAYLDLSSGRLDAILADKFVNWGWLKSAAGQDFEFKGEPVFDNDKVGIAVRKGDDALRKKLNAALKAIVANGTYQKINDKYFPFNIYH